jgi:hypothetical protein
VSLYRAPGKTVDQLDVRIEQRADGSVVSIRTRSPGARPAPAQPAAAYIVDATAIDSTIAVITPQWRVAPDNYLGSARVEASDDLKHWRTVVAGAPLAYLQQGQARLVQERIEFAPTRSRYYRLSFAPAAPELEGIAAASPPARAGTAPAERVTGAPGPTLVKSSSICGCARRWIACG